jgi:hypothetical protein
VNSLYEVMGPIGFFVVVAIIVQIIFDYKLKVRLIEKGLVDEKLKYLYQKQSERSVPSSLKWGMVLFGIGAAIIFGRIVPYDIADEVTIAGMFIMAGLALLIYAFVVYRVERRQAGAGTAD